MPLRYSCKFQDNRFGFTQGKSDSSLSVEGCVCKVGDSFSFEPFILLIWAIHEETAVDTSTYDEDWLTVICAMAWMASEVRFSPEILFYKLPYIVFNYLYHALLFCNMCVNHCTLSQFWKRQWQYTPVLLPGKSHGQRSLVGCSPRGH